MTLRLPRCDRLMLLGCAMAAFALAGSGCGNGGDATAESAASSRTETTPKATAAVTCPRQVRRFVDALDGTRSRLAVGLSYEQYAARVKDLRVAYGRIPVARLTLACLSHQGTPGERALNEYIDAANAWGECLADAACTTPSIEPILQRKWRVASRFIAEAQ